MARCDTMYIPLFKHTCGLQVRKKIVRRGIGSLPCSCDRYEIILCGMDVQ